MKHISRRFDEILSASRLWLEGGWLFGVAIILLQLSVHYMPVGEPRDWLQYYVMGVWATVFFMGHMAAMCLNPVWEKSGWAYGFTAIKMMCTAYTIFFASTVFMPVLLNGFFIPLLILTSIITVIWMRLFVIARSAVTRICCALAIEWFLLALFSVMVKLWSEFEVVYLNKNIFTSLSLGCILALVFAVLWTPLGKIKWSKKVPLWYYPAHGLVIYLLASICFNTDGVVSYTKFGGFVHHWKAYLEPAASIRSGGWLLWDVPAQYGFLQTLAIAIFPANIWQSFYLLNSSFLMLSYYMIFVFMFSKYRGILGYIFCSITVIYISSLVSQIIDPRVFPSTGVMRFFWVYVIAGYTFYRFRQACASITSCGYHYGNILWLCGVLWSFESAIFVTIMWLPCIAMIAIAEKKYPGDVVKYPIIVKYAAYRIFQATLLLACASFGIIFIYMIFLGHLPEMQLIWIYVDIYKTGYKVPIESMGKIICFLFMFLLIGFIFTAHLARGKWNSYNILNAVPLYAALSGLWCAASYYIPDSHEYQFFFFLPIAVYMSSIIGLILPNLAVPVALQELYKAFLTFFFASILFLAVIVVTPSILMQYLRWPLVTDDIGAIMPTVPPELSAIMSAVPDDATVFDLTVNEVYNIPRIRPWILPNSLVAWLLPLPADIYKRFAERGAERGCQYGWAVENNRWPLESDSYINLTHNKYYIEIDGYENEKYTIRRFKKRMPASC